MPLSILSCYSLLCSGLVGFEFEEIIWVVDGEFLPDWIILGIPILLRIVDVKILVGVVSWLEFALSGLFLLLG